MSSRRWWRILTTAICQRLVVTLQIGQPRWRASGMWSLGRPGRVCARRFIVACPPGGGIRCRSMSKIWSCRWLASRRNRAAEHCASAGGSAVALANGIGSIGPVQPMQRGNRAAEHCASAGGSAAALANGIGSIGPVQPMQRAARLLGEIETVCSLRLKRKKHCQCLSSLDLLIHSCRIHAHQTDAKRHSWIISDITDIWYLISPADADRSDTILANIFITITNKNHAAMQPVLSSVFGSSLVARQLDFLRTRSFWC